MAIASAEGAHRLSNFYRPPKRRRVRGTIDAATRARHARTAIELFNSGAFWEAHEALEEIWKTVEDDSEALIIQGLIQAAAALLHLERGNRHGVEVVGNGALEKLDGPQHPAVEFETERFRRELARALSGNGVPPTLELRKRDQGNE